MKAVLAALLFVAAPLIAGDAAIFPPPATDSHTSVDVTMHGIWRDGGVPQVKSVVVNGKTISIALAPYHGLTIQTFTPWRATAHLGVLSAGLYDVQASISGDPSPADHAVLIVRDTDAFRVNPAAIPIGGDDVSVALTPPVFSEADRDRVTQISIDGGPFVDADPNGVMHVAAHAAGTFDAVVKTAKGSTYTATAAVSFFDPAAPADLSLLEPVLFPVSFEGGGAFSSRWSVTNMLLFPAPSWFRSALPCSGCTNMRQRLAILQPNGSAAGQLLWAVRGANNFIASSNVRELNGGAVARVPFFREADLRDSKAFIADVPHLPHARTILRAWIFTAHAGGAGTLFVEVYNITKSEVVSAGLTRTSPDEPLFGAADITGALDDLNDGTPILIIVHPIEPYGDDAKLWSLLSITDDATQQMTLIPAQ